MTQPHNLVRHPDMPREAFADMWATLQACETWTALVKNCRKNGDHYWVRANATPIRRNGQVTGYMSVRTKPSHAETIGAEALYRAFREGRAGSRRFHKGLVVRPGALAWMSAPQVMPVRWRVPGAFAALAAGQPAENVNFDRVDEIGLILRAVNQAGLKLRSLVDDVSERVSGLQTAASMEQRTATVQQNAETARQATQLGAAPATRRPAATRSSRPGCARWRGAAPAPPRKYAR